MNRGPLNADLYQHPQPCVTLLFAQLPDGPLSEDALRELRGALRLKAGGSFGTIELEVFPDAYSKTVQWLGLYPSAIGIPATLCLDLVHELFGEQWLAINWHRSVLELLPAARAKAEARLAQLHS